MDSTFQELKKAHSLLMSKYVDVLNRVPDLPFFVPSQFKAGYMEVVWPKVRTRSSSPQKDNFFSSLTSLFSLRYLVRLFVELHIRAKLL